LFYMEKSTKYWLGGAICIFLINLIFFMFRNEVHETVLLWVVILTPVACLGLYPLTRILDNQEESHNENEV